MEKFTNILNESTELSGKNGFDILLDIINQYNILFVKQDYINTADYSYFFTSEKLTKRQEILDTLSRKSSLKTAYMTLGQLSDMRLSCYFGVKGYTLFYGFYNEDNRYVYKVGKFKVSTKDLRTYAKIKCLKTIRYTLSRSNLKNMKTLQDIKVDFHTLFDKIDNDVEILDEYRISNTFPVSIFRQEDRDDMKLTSTLNNWAKNFKWYKHCTFFTSISEDKVSFYIKMKDLKGLMGFTSR